MLQRNDRCVGDDADRQSCAVQNARCRKALVPQLDLALAAERRANKDRIALLSQLVRDDLTVGAVVERQLEVKLPRDAHGGQNIVRAVRVALDRNFSVHDRQHRFQLHVQRRIFSCRLVVAVADGAHQQLAQKSGHGHTRHGTLLFALSVAALRVFAERAFHRRRRPQYHLVNTLACQLENGERAADDVCTAGAGAGCRHAAAQRQTERLILRIDRVDRAQLRRQRINDLVIVHAFPTHGLIVKADVAVCLHAARREQPPLRINDLCAHGRVDLRRNCGDFSVLNQQTAVRNIRSGHRFDVCVLNQQHIVSPFTAPIRCFLQYNASRRQKASAVFPQSARQKRQMLL